MNSYRRTRTTAAPTRRATALRALSTAAMFVACAGSASVALAGPAAAFLTGIGVNLTTDISLTDRAPSLWTPTASGVTYTIEDLVGPSGQVFPGYGGQPYDLEALYWQVVGSTLKIAGVSGNTSSAASLFTTTSGTCSAGDCRNFGIGDIFIGRGTSTGFSPFAAVEMTGKYLQMDGSGHTTGWTSPLAAGQVVGVSGAVGTSTVAPTPQGWELGLSAWGANFRPGAPTQIATSGYTNTSYATTVSWEVVGARSLYYTSIDLSNSAMQSLFAPTGGVSTPFTVHWGEICGNDFLQVQGTPSTNQVPVPSSAALLALGGLLLTATRRRNRRAAAA